MTRPDQKISERRTLDAVLAALDLSPDQEPEAGEAPDFVVRLSGRAVGVEITMYRSGAPVEGGMRRRMVESEWDHLAEAADTFRRAQPDIGDVNVGLMFRGPVPPRKRHDDFIAEVAAFIRDHAAELQSGEMEYWPPAFSTSLMRSYLRTLYLRRDRHAIWHSNLAAGSVARPDRTIAAIVAEKSGRSFRPCDELWLAIQSSTRISEVLSDLLGVDDFETVPSLEPFVFSRVFVLAFTGAYQWKRGEGWQRLTGGSQEDRGPTLDQLKATLNDQEWLDDPDDKARKVAAETLRELRGGGE